MATPKAVIELKVRMDAIEAEVARLKQQMEVVSPAPEPWWRKIAGSFEDDPMYEEAMRLGREYRESLRPKATKQIAKRRKP